MELYLLSIVLPALGFVSAAIGVLVSAEADRSGWLKRLGPLRTATIFVSLAFAICTAWVGYLQHLSGEKLNGQLDEANRKLDQANMELARVSEVSRTAEGEKYFHNQLVGELNQIVLDGVKGAGTLSLHVTGYCEVAEVGMTNIIGKYKKIQAGPLVFSVKVPADAVSVVVKKQPPNLSTGRSFGQLCKAHYKFVKE
ncbi:hypothetical protein SAMN04488118_102454 [Epibacterium ulvae]|uniref:Uncharacterized protein n=1 Tax=Epibacterium ulvae TaxID=1156985 RepID=A0A1G5Q2H9_9RHOB|nr:hypothetical protein [Epibacterium ulvae]SCZ55660.1 hypothetical protein SAMN04488118_102454 [Epibacterium ulvae]